MKSKQLSQDKEAQCARLLQRLKKGSCSTVEARHEEDVLSPAPRVYDLRHKYGYNIHTHWTNGYNPGGGRHRIAKYILLPGKWKGGANETA